MRWLEGQGARQMGRKVAVPQWSQVYVCTGQYRKHTCVFSSLMLEDARETVVGAIVYVKLSENGRYELEADRYQYTVDSGSVQPDGYMVDTMLMLQGLLKGAQLAPTGRVYSTNTSLIKKLMDGRQRRKWVKTQQGVLAECIWERLQTLQWAATAIQVPGGCYDKLTDIETKGAYIAEEIAARGLEGVPGGEALTIGEQTFVDLQSQLEGQFGWTWVENATNRIALTETLPMVQKADRRRALVKRDAERVKRGDREIWGSNTLKFAAERLQLKEAGIARRGHWCRMEHKRHWTVGSNRCKGVKDPVDKQKALECVLCHEDDSYDHWIRRCGCKQLSDVRLKHQRAYREWSAALPTLAEQELAGLILWLSMKPDGHRVAMANWSQVQFAILWRRVPDPEYAMAKRILFGAQDRLFEMIEELWRERCAATGAKVYHAPLRRGKAKVYAVRKGKRPGIYYTLIQAEEQVNGFLSAEWRSFRSVKSAMAYMDEGIREEEGTGSTRVAEVFTDGSFFKSPDRAGWGYLILGHADKDTFYRDRTILQQAQGPVSLSRWDEEHYLGARALTNNTGELSAMGNAMKWLLSEIEAGRLGDTEEVTITSDSLYAIQMVRGAWKAKSNKLMIWKLKELKKRLGEKMHVRLRWTKAHT